MLCRRTTPADSRRPKRRCKLVVSGAVTELRIQQCRPSHLGAAVPEKITDWTMFVSAPLSLILPCSVIPSSPTSSSTEEFVDEIRRLLETSSTPFDVKPIDRNSFRKASSFASRTFVVTYSCGGASFLATSSRWGNSQNTGMLNNQHCSVSWRRAEEAVSISRRRSSCVLEGGGRGRKQKDVIRMRCSVFLQLYLITFRNAMMCGHSVEWLAPSSPIIRIHIFDVTSSGSGLHTQEGS